MKKLALALLMLSIGLSCAQESPQWSSLPWIDPMNSSSSSANIILADLASFNISGNEPLAVHLGKESISYEKYKSCIRSTELWLQSGTNWTRQSDVFKGDSLELIAFMPSGGNADLYWIDYANSSISHRGYALSPGYYNATIQVNQIGRVIIVLTVEGQPSNALVLDVQSQKEAPKGPKDVGQFSPGFAQVTITSDGIRGYDVYLDGVFYSSDLADGTYDGTASFKVGGDSVHTITISRKGGPGIQAYWSEHTKSFQSGNIYLLKI